MSKITVKAFWKSSHPTGNICEEQARCTHSVEKPKNHSHLRKISWIWFTMSLIYGKVIIVKILQFLFINCESKIQSLPQCVKHRPSQFSFFPLFLSTATPLNIKKILHIYLVFFMLVHQNINLYNMTNI